MIRHFVAVAAIASLALAVPATLTSKPDERARPSPQEARASWERVRTAVALRRDALAAHAINSTELDPVTVDALRALALEAAIGSGERHPYDGRVYVTTVRKAAAATGDGVPDDRRVFWVMLRGHFVFERHGPPGMEPGPPPTATLINFMLSAKTLRSVGGGYSNVASDTSGLGPPTPLDLDPPHDSWRQDCVAANERALLARQVRNRAVTAGEITTELNPLTVDALRALAYQVGTCSGDAHPFARVQVTTRRAANRIWNAGIDSDRPSFFVILDGAFDHAFWKADPPINPTSPVAATATWISVVVDAETLRMTDYGVGMRADDSRGLGPAVPLIP
jgi:hypothetical protein